LEDELSGFTGNFAINKGDTDGMDSDPNVTSSVPTVAGSTRLFTIQERGHLNCGVALSNGFASKTEDGGLEGFDIDLCRAIAAAIFEDSEKVMFQVLTFAERFSALSDDISDVVGLTTHTMERDVHQASTKDGKSFTTPYFYEGLGWGGLPEFVECADNRYLFPECTGVDICLPVECIGLKICLPTGTTWIDWAYTVFPEEFPEENIVPVNTPADSFFALSNGLCNVVGGERHDLAEETIRFVTGYTGPYVLGSKLFSKEPIALMTREDDPRWSLDRSSRFTRR
jgi:general L-amino acid transport system substrate-binding protein